MFDESKICPYTGLRPFSEEESLYFKGRDENIEQATRQLEKNKFLILTGASGDGKSSLIFAGVIPNARAGFLKSRFSNWAVADFRPERTPFKNLCNSIVSQLRISNTETVEAELSRGFSALVDLYKASPLWYDESEISWQQANPQEQTKIKREAANLIVLADQFEEFFTNPENYSKGVPSQEAALVTNILLETARISLEEKLPIYVVITMRSDFIGQCAAFRGLPEYIGFSQFFVPRLNRKQLQEVIEEPAILSGNSISRRLTERLIEDLTEGADQLPILQHTLNQIWKKASEKDEEMDLIHYAMVGGMDSKELPQDESEQFHRWFNNLPQKIRNCYDKPGLHNVLNTHANIITNQVGDYVLEKFNDSIPEDKVNLIVKTAFKCLTKINQGRAVRNRMTLLEIREIINQPQLDNKKVANVLNIFRDPDNTLLKPFITDEPNLQEDTVLDITHESLIRNWKQLGEWATEEFDNYTIFLDFRQQLERWVASGKSSDFLLSIGPLTYFENWFNKANPNQHWIARYESDHATDEDKLTQGSNLLAQARAFLKRSSRKHFVTRTVMHYGPKKIALVLAAIILLTTSSFVINNYVKQQSSVVRKFLVDESLRYNNDPSIQNIQKVAAISHQLRLGEVSMKRIIANLNDYRDKLNIATHVASYNILEARDAHDKEIFDCFIIADSILHQTISTLSPQTDLDFILEESNDLMAILEYANYYTNNDTLKDLLQRNALREASLVKYILRNKPANFKNIKELNGALDYGLNHKAFSKAELDTIIKILSPFEQEQSDWIKNLYAPGQLYITGIGNNGFRCGGLYQQLAYLYAATGNQHHLEQCMDSLLSHKEYYPDRKYINNSDNAFNIVSYFYAYDHIDKLDAFVKKYCSREGVAISDFYEKLLARTDVYLMSSIPLDIIGSPFANKNHNTNIEFATAKMVSFFSDRLRTSIINAYTPSAKNFKLALAYKNEAIHLSKRYQDMGASFDTDLINKLYSQAFSAYDHVDSAYQNEIIPCVDGFSQSEINIPRKYLFAYPDLRLAFITYPGVGHFFYKSSSFIDYAIDNNRFNDLYKTTQEISWIEEWISAQNHQITVRLLNGKILQHNFLVKLEKSLRALSQAKNLDFNLLYLMLGNESALKADKEQAIDYYHRIDPTKIRKHFSQLQGAVFHFQNCTILRMLSYAVSDLTKYGDFDWAYSLISSFENPINRSSIYAFAARNIIYNDNDKGPIVNQLIDSSYQEMRRVQNVDDQPNRITLAGTLALRNGPNDISEAFKVIKNIEFKQIGIWMICRGLVFNDEFYKAYKTIPDNLSDDDIMGYFFEIYDYCKAGEGQSAFWKKIENTGFIGNERLDYIP